MKRIILFLSIAAIVMACSENKERPSSWHGVWQAQWETDPASFPQSEGVTDYTMPGKVTVGDDSIMIEAFGFEGCIFSKDTLRHSLSWKIQNDSLILINDEDTPGMIYTIKEQSDDRIRLQLMEDIFLTLNK